MVLLKSYSSQNGWALAEVQLRSYRCDDLAGEAFQYQWFAVSPDRDVTYLGHGLQLLDAGDYDGDGKSELIFMIGGCDSAGYEMFYDGFRKHTSFEFVYH